MIKKLIYILNKKQKTSLFFLMILTIVAMILEVASLGLIIPFIQILVEDNSPVEFNQSIISILPE